MSLMFFPRGGSAQVARYMARALPRAGWDVTLLTGSLGPEGEQSNAATFFAGADVHAVDYSHAIEADDPLACDPPLHPSFEDRADAPDRVFAKLDDEVYERLVSAWERELDAAGAGDADVLHLHHLTPMNEAAARAFPGVPVVGHLHGTEVLMLREIERGPPKGWDHAEAWAERMRRWAQGCERLFVLSPDAVERVPDMLGVDPDRVVWAPNGFEPDTFDRRPKQGDERVALWRRWLVEEPRGWDPESQKPGSVSYEESDLEAFRGTVLLYVGRYTEVKRLPLLIRAHARARERFDHPAPLVLLGGYPGPNSTAGTPASMKLMASEAPSRPTEMRSAGVPSCTASASAVTKGWSRATFAGCRWNTVLTRVSGIASISDRISRTSCPGR